MIGKHDVIVNLVKRQLQQMYHEQYNTLYYKHQLPDNYNQRQQYHHHITTQQYPYRTDYDKEKVNNVVLIIVKYLHLA